MRYPGLRLNFVVVMVAALGFGSTAVSKLQAAAGSGATGNPVGAKNNAGTMEIQLTSGKTVALTPGAGPDSDLLLRLRFAGTTPLMANSKAAFLTNIASLPETAALGRRLAERAAELTALMAGRREIVEARTAPTQSFAINYKTPSATNGAQLLAPVFEELMRSGCLVELHGDAVGGPAWLQLAAQGNAETIKRYSEAFGQAARAWYGSEPVKLTHGSGWTVGNGAARFETKEKEGIWAVRITNEKFKKQNSKGEEAITPQVASLKMGEGVALEGEVGGALLPEAFRKSVYGGLATFKFSLRPDENSLRLRGTARYAADLPALGRSPVVPTNLIPTELPSFTLVRHPDRWLAPASALRGYLPAPMPEALYFWGGILPMQMSMAMPYPDAPSFASHYGPALKARVQAVTKEWEVNGPIGMKGNGQEFRIGGMPYLSPKLELRKEGGMGYLVGEVFPGPGFEEKLAQPLLDYIGQHPNLVLYDWELTGLRLNSWIQVAQLMLLVSHHHQLDPETASIKWIMAVQKATAAGNAVTDVSQTGPRELTVARRSPLVFTSAEIYWLAHWLESANFPSLDFLIKEEPEKIPQ